MINRPLVFVYDTSTPEMWAVGILSAIGILIFIIVFAYYQTKWPNDEQTETSEHTPNNQYSDCFMELADLRFDVLNRCEFFLTQISELEARIQKKIDADIQDWHDNGVAGIDIDKEETKD